MNHRDRAVFLKMIEHAEVVAAAIQKYGKTQDRVFEDAVVRDGIAMNVLQVGELVQHLAKETREQHANIMPWHEMIGMRNIAVHNYGKFNANLLWLTATEDLPHLSAIIHQILKNEGEPTCKTSA